MSSDKIPDEYTTLSGDLIEIAHDKKGYVVRCWTPGDDDVPGDSFNLHWEVRGVKVADEGQFREVRRAFTLEEALVEFNRWR